MSKLDDIEEITNRNDIVPFDELAHAGLPDGFDVMLSLVATRSGRERYRLCALSLLQDQ
jgi:hypothetical protein